MAGSRVGAVALRSRMVGRSHHTAAARSRADALCSRVVVHLSRSLARSVGHPALVVREAVLSVHADCPVVRAVGLPFRAVGSRPRLVGVRSRSAVFRYSVPVLVVRLPVLRSPLAAARVGPAACRVSADGWLAHTPPARSTTPLAFFLNSPAVRRVPVPFSGKSPAIFLTSPAVRGMPVALSGHAPVAFRN
jgi:hypothetical protein